MIVTLNVEARIRRVQHSRAWALLLFTVVAISAREALAETSAGITGALAVTLKLVAAA